MGHWDAFPEEAPPYIQPYVAHHEHVVSKLLYPHILDRGNLQGSVPMRVPRGDQSVRRIPWHPSACSAGNQNQLPPWGRRAKRPGNTTRPDPCV